MPTPRLPHPFLFVIGLFLLGFSLKAAEPALPPATWHAVAYGPHPRQLLDIWAAPGNGPRPVCLFIHGGGWVMYDRFKFVGELLQPLLDHGVSVVSIDYRYLREATQDGLVPPVKGPMEDAQRALQTIRARAAEWNLDPIRVVTAGGSAGGCTALWLAFHDEMADPDSSDPIARQSTRILGAAVNNAQTSLDPEQMREWTPNSEYGSLAFGIPNRDGRMDFAAFLARRDELMPHIRVYSPWELVTPDDPPVFLYYPKDAPALGQPKKDPTHTANFGAKLQERMQTIGVPCELVHQRSVAPAHQTPADWIVWRLGQVGPYPPMPTSGLRELIYTDFNAKDVLKTGWEQSNRNTMGTLRSTGTTRNRSQRSYSIEFRAADAYAGLWCKNNAFDTQRYASVSFWIHGGVDGDQQVDVQAVRADGSFKSFRLAPLKSGHWQQVTIALTDLGVAGASDLAHLRFVNKGASAAKVFYVEDLSFDVLTEPQTELYAEGIKSGWTQQNRNCDGTPLNTVSPRTGLRSYAIRFLAADAYAGMGSPDTLYNVGTQAALTFWIHGGSVGGQRIEIQAVRAGGALPGKLLEPLKVGTWQKVTVYLDELGILGATDLSAIRFVNRSGGATETLYVDDVWFDEAMPETVKGTL